MKPATASDPVAIELVDVCKAFGAGPEAKPAWAVDHMNLKIRAGEFFTFLGPSGCGKTTTLRMIAGFEAPTQGSILLDGHDVSGLPPHRRNVNTVFQSYALFPHLTVEDNVAFGLAVKGVPKAERRERVHAALASVRMGHTADRKPSQLSGGQQQRVALARALVNEPSVLLLDEPFGALDLKLRREMQLEVKDMQRKLGITFVFVTHDQEEALTMSDRIAVMRAGVIHQVDDPVGIYERPADAFTASFIGEMNMLPARVTACGALGVDFNCGGTVVRLSRDAALSPLSPGDTCILAIRPEAISFRAEEGAAGISFFGTAGVSIYIGTDRLCMVMLPTGETLHVRVRNTAGTAAVPQPGSPVQLVCPASAVHRLKNQDL